MTIAAHTGATEKRACHVCGAIVEHREVEFLSCGPSGSTWKAQRHAAPCGQPCIGGGTSGTNFCLTFELPEMHGFRDRCPQCGWLRVVPEVAAEMRQRATEAKARADAAKQGPWLVDQEDDENESHVVYRKLQNVAPDAAEVIVTADWATEADMSFIATARTDVPEISADLLRCLDEIVVVADERDQAKRECNNLAQVVKDIYAAVAFSGEIDGKRTLPEVVQSIVRKAKAMTESPQDIGRLINAAASAGAHRVEAEEVVARLANPRTESARRALQNARERLAAAKVDEHAAKDRLEQARRCGCPATPEGVHVCDWRCT